MSVLKEIRTEKRYCPECRSQQVRRSHLRGFWERGVLKMIGVRAYRCESCDKRYYEFKGIEDKGGKLEGSKARENRDER